MNRSNDDETLADPTVAENLASDVPPVQYQASIPEETLVERAHWARDPLYWTQRMRLGQFFQLMPGLLNSCEDRELLVHKWLSNGIRTKTACELLNLDTKGTIAQRQARLVACPDSAYLLLACAFAVGKKDKAIEQTANLRLSAKTRNRYGENDRIDDRHVAIMVLFNDDPTSLQTLRVLNEWHSLTAASADLNEMHPLPEHSIETFLLSDDFLDLLHHEKARFDSLIPMGPGHWLLALNRNYRAQHIIGSDEQILHGWGEETVIVHFRDGGRRVRISARSGLPSRLLASRIAAKYFGKACHYAPDLAASTMESIYAMVDAALDPSDDMLELTGIKWNGALPGKSTATLSGTAPVKETFDSLCSNYGDLLNRLQCVKRLEVRFEHRIFNLYILRLNGQWVVQFADGRSDNVKAAAFRRYLLERFNVEVRSKATSGRWAA